MTPTGGLQNAVADYDTIHDFSVIILETLSKQDASIGYSMLASAMTLGRLANTGDAMEPEDECVWLQAVMDFSTAYFSDGMGMN